VEEPTSPWVKEQALRLLTMMIMMEMDITPSVVLPEMFLAYLLSCFVWTRKFHSLYTAVCVWGVCKLLQKMVAPFRVMCYGRLVVLAISLECCVCDCFSWSRNWICTV